MTNPPSIIATILRASRWILLLAIVVTSIFGASKQAKLMRNKDRQSAKIARTEFPLASRASATNWRLRQLNIEPAGYEKLQVLRNDQVNQLDVRLFRKGCGVNPRGTGNERITHFEEFLLGRAFHTFEEQQRA